MIPVRFTEANAILGERQDEYEPIAAYVFHDGRIACCFRLSEAEIQELTTTRTLWVQQLTFGNAFHPIALSTQRPPDMPVAKEEL